MSCDWGTSNFRLRLIDTATLGVILSSQSDEGVAKVFEQWQQAGEPTDRILFYQNIIQQHVGALERLAGRSLAGVPIVASGMASSSIGMMALPYQQLPFFVAGADLLHKVIEAGAAFDHRTILLSGARTEKDVMRGEETQLAGCVTEIENGAQVFIFPGTHSKHISVAKGFANHFTTYMTGEFFQLLSTNSILSNSVAQNNALHEGAHTAAFQKGVSDGSSHHLLHQGFMVRTNDLFQRYSKEENYWYLSGLLIGAELNALRQIPPECAITIVGSGTMVTLYRLALEALGMQPAGVVDVTEALIRAHALILDKVYANAQQSKE